MITSTFDHVDTWVFDLDHTLYPPSARLFDQIEALMTRYVSEVLDVDTNTANRLRAEYWREYGTTLAGLMHVHGIDPDPYLVAVHDIDFSVLTPNPALAEAITALPGRKIVYTNGSAPYARQVLKALGLTETMQAVYGVEDAAYAPKPAREAFETVFAKAGVVADRGAMFEDDPRNLAVPFNLGMRTIHVAETPQPAPHIQHHTADLIGFLSQVMR